MGYIKSFQNVEPYINKTSPKKFKHFKCHENFNDPREHPLLTSVSNPHFQNILNTFGKLDEIETLGNEFQVQTAKVSDSKKDIQDK